MAFTVTVKNCSDGGGITGATFGNGNCYTTGSSGTYTFSTCDDLAACAGSSGLTITASPTTLPASGGSATFTIYKYGIPSGKYNARKSKTGTGGSSWTGSVSITNVTCPSSQTVSLTASANSTASQVVYKLARFDTEATVTQSAKSCSYGFYIGNEIACNIQISGGGTTIVRCDRDDIGLLILSRDEATVYSIFQWTRCDEILMSGEIAGMGPITAHDNIPNGQIKVRLAIASGQSSNITVLDEVDIDIPCDGIVNLNDYLQPSYQWKVE